MFAQLIDAQKVSDKVSIGISALCLLHCLLFPSLMVLLSSFISVSLNSELIHYMLLFLVVPVSSFALIVGLNKKNGEIMWKFKNQFPFRGNITIKDDYLFANDYNDNLIAFLENKLIWKKKLGQSENAIFTTIRPIIHKNIIINPPIIPLF